MITYQDYLKAENKARWIGDAIARYMRSDAYKLALDADEYEAQRNVTIRKTVRLVYDITGVAAEDVTSANNKMASNFFHRLNTDRCSYSLGNGITFPSVKRLDENGQEVSVDETKDALGNEFDTQLTDAAYYALIHGVSFLFVNDSSYHVFPMTQFLPLWDEADGTLKAGIRFWSLEWRKRPIQAVLYEEDGYTSYQTAPGKYGLGALQEQERKRPYKQLVQISEADGEEVVGESNYGLLPIVPVYASRSKQSTLVGMRANIDAYDMIQSGFANDLQDCAQVYWLIGNAMGMDDGDVAKLRDRLMFQHMAVVDTDNSSIHPYTQEIPYSARQVCLQSIRSNLYENFGVLDVHSVEAGATNDHIDAGYQPMDQEADDFEYQIIKAVQQVLRIKGMEPLVPQFHRNKISNQKEQVEMVMLAAEYLDDKTVLKNLPFVTVDEIEGIRQGRERDEGQRFVTEE